MEPDQLLQEYVEARQRSAEGQLQQADAESAQWAEYFQRFRLCIQQCLEAERVLAGFAAQLLGEGYRGGLEGLHLQELGKGEISDLSAKFQYVVCALRALVEEANHCRDRTCIRQPTWQVLEQWGWMISPSPNCTPILSPEGKSIARRYEEFAASAGEGTSIPPPPPKRPPAPGNVT